MKQSNNGKNLKVRDNNQINETIKLKKKFKCARDTNETIK